MRIVGIIAEYNPFHNGHAWQIEQLRQRGFDAVVCVCSPGVVQRGEPAMLPTPVRTAAALAGGADLVISLPAPYAVLSSEGFAAAGVALLTALGCVDTLCFGVEKGRTEEFTWVAEVLEGADFPPLLREKLDAGLPLPAARAAAAGQLCPGAGAMLQEGNALLGVDYCRAILRQKSGLVPLALPRMGAAHDAPLEQAGTMGAPPPEQWEAPQKKSPALPSESAAQVKHAPLRFENTAGAEAVPGLADASKKKYASASALRALAGREGAAALAPYVPAACLALYKQAEAEGAWIDDNAFSAAALSRLRMLSAQQLRCVRGAAEGLEHRLAAAIRSAGTWDALIDMMKTKRYATARLRRFALDAVLGYTATPGDAAQSGHTISPGQTPAPEHTPALGNMPALPPYLHVLGANEAGRAVLSAAKATARLPLSHSLARLARENTQTAAVAAAHAAAEDFTALCLRRPAPMGTAYTVKAQFVP